MSGVDYKLRAPKTIGFYNFNEPMIRGQRRLFISIFQTKSKHLLTQNQQIAKQTSEIRNLKALQNL